MQQSTLVEDDGSELRLGDGNSGNIEINVVSALQKNLNVSDLGFSSEYKKSALSEIMSEKIKL